MKPLSLFILAIVACTFQNSFAQIPILNSYPSARATVYLDFDGQYVSGTSWNAAGAITAQAAALSAPDITEIFNRIAEDYRPFNLNITTDSNVFNNAPRFQRIRIIFTPTSEWYCSCAGGTSYVGSFTWGDNTPSWVFSSLLANNPKYVAESASHEIGHTLGLQHQSTYDSACNKVAEYSAGQGSGEIGWAPIMGTGYYKNLTTWHTGSSTIGCSTVQNDLSIIAGSPNNFGFRDDDYGNNHKTASAVIMSGNNFAISGIINQPGDRDAFKVNIPYNSEFLLNAIPNNVGSGDNGANVDIKISLLNGTADTLGHYNPANLLDAGIDTILKAGTYYLVIDGVGNVNHSNYGSLGLYGMTGSLFGTLAENKFALTGKTEHGMQTLDWNFESDEVAERFVIESSSDGVHFQTLATVSSTTHHFSYTPIGQIDLQYRIRAQLAGIISNSYSNIISIKNLIAGKPVQVLNNPVIANITVTSRGSCDYRLIDLSGRVLTRGRLLDGVNTIPVNAAVKGMLLLQWQNGTDRGIEKLIKE